MMDTDNNREDICRVCRSEAVPDRPLFHPCICTGSIKWIHQECLVQWMRYSRKEYCELCGHRFSFTPIYSPDMPRHLPLRDLLAGLLNSILTAVRYWLHYTLVAVAWLGIVPVTACRMYRLLFFGRIETALVDFLTTDGLASDIFHGCFVVTCTLFTFIGLVWLREQILHGGGPDWLERGAGADGAQVGEGLNEGGAAQGADVGNNNGPNPVNIDEPAAAQQPAHNDDPAAAAAAAAVNAPLDQPDAAAAAAPEPLPPAPEPAAAAAAAAAAALPLNNEENNWIPVEWDRGAEELTWERLLGLDGSLVFLEHVFWVVSLNTLFIFVFAFCPYHLGLLFVQVVNVQDTVHASHFEGLLLTLLGYCLVGLLLVCLHRGAALVGLVRARKLLGLCYVVVKVSMLSVVEIGILPLVCGWWLDICSLAMFDATLRDRESSFRSAPGTSIFIHWLIGMVYVYYFASFVLLLREIVRPGVLWFLRNLNDPDFSPIQEMIHLPVLRHLRRLLLSTVIFGSAVMLMLWLPIRIVRWLLPGFLPYTVSLNSEAQVNELSLELLLLQVVLPALLEQSHTRTWLKALVRSWCRLVSWVLDLHSYLLGDGDGHQAGDGPAAAAPAPAAAAAAAPPAPNAGNGNAAPAPAAGVNAAEGGGGGGGGGLGAAHQALLMREGPTGFQPYDRPTLFPFRILLLLGLVCLTQVLSSLIVLTLPVWLGRRVMAVWLTADNTVAVTAATAAGAAATVAPAAATVATGAAAVADAGLAAVVGGTGGGVLKVHELYTAACGTYMCWLVARACALVISWLPQGRAAMLNRLRHWSLIGLKTTLAGILLLGIIPLLFGLLLELVVIVPIRVPVHQTPVLFLWQDWALGVLYTKIACAVTMMGPDWFLRTAIERVYRDGIRDMHLSFVVRQIAAPVIMTAGLALAIPYVVAHSIIPLFVASTQTRNLIARRLYPFLLLVGVISVIVALQIRQFHKLYEHIKNDKYLVGQRLVNYDHRKEGSSRKSNTSGGAANVNNG